MQKEGGSNNSRKRPLSANSSGSEQSGNRESDGLAVKVIRAIEDIVRQKLKNSRNYF
ncbi:MAG: hypothetical protein ACFFD4_09805 [Candidatus Odinarchaeota archaeon]